MQNVKRLNRFPIAIYLRVVILARPVLIVPLLRTKRWLILYQKAD